MAKQFCDSMNDNTNAKYSNSNSSSVSVSANTWTKLVTLSPSGGFVPGKYLVFSSVSATVNSKITYGRLYKNGFDGTAIANSPYGTGNFTDLITLESGDTLDLYVYAPAFDCSAYNATIMVIQQF